MSEPANEPRRILIIDDNEAIHKDFRKVLGADLRRPDFSSAKAALFGDGDDQKPKTLFELDSALQGQEALKKVQDSCAAGRAFSLAFVDMRMPPGWDGVETIRRLWEVDRELQIVICTAYSDYSWSEITAELRPGDGLLILKKPFDNIEVLQMASALTDKWRATRQARTRMDCLDQMVNERTAALRAEIAERERIQAALKSKEELIRRSQRLEAVGQLAGGIAHEFNNLLQGILGYSRLAMASLPPEGQVQQDLKQVYGAAQRAAKLTNQLLNFSRHARPDWSPLDVNDTVLKIVDMVRQLISEQITVELNLADKLGMILGDSDMLEQVVMNLCLNARDAMSGDGKLTISTVDEVVSEKYCEFHPDLPPGRYVVLSVSDTGRGMTREVQQRIFDPFFSTKEVGAGTGLGLATVYGIVRQHAGSVTVYSEPGIGTTFRVRIPVAGSVLVSRNDFDAPREFENEPGGGELILVADDEPLVRSVAVRILQEVGGYRTLEAVHGEHALELFERHQAEVDLLLLDVVMPKLNGRDLYQRIQATRPDIPAIFCTGYDPTAGLSGQAANDGCPVIEKPFKPELLLRTVRETIERAAPCQVPATSI